MANATENVEANYILLPILESIMKILHVCEVCDCTYEGGAGVGTIVWPIIVNCLDMKILRQFERHIKYGVLFTS